MRRHRKNFILITNLWATKITVRRVSHLRGVAFVDLSAQTLCCQSDDDDDIRAVYYSTPFNQRVLVRIS